MQFGLLSMMDPRRMTQPRGSWAPTPPPIIAPPEEPQPVPGGMQPATSPLQGLTPNQAKPYPNSSAPGFLQRFTQFSQSNPGLLMQIGGALANADKSFGENMLQAGLLWQQGAESREEREFRKEERDYMRSERTRETEERQRLTTEHSAAVKAAEDSGNTELARALRAVGPRGLAEIMAGQMTTPAMRQQQMQFDTELAFRQREGELDRDTQRYVARLNAAGRTNEIREIFTRMDATQLGAMNQGAAQIQSTALPALRTLRENILRAGQTATGQPIDADTRITLSRVFNGSTSDRQSLETWRARILGPAIETLRGTGPMSEKELDAAINSFANPNMTLGSALELINEQIAKAERGVTQAQAANEFFRDANGLTGARNQAGQDWPTFLQSRLGGTQQQAPAASSPAAPPSQAAQPARAPPRVGEERNGYIYRGGDPGNQSSWQVTAREGQRRGANLGREVSNFFSQFQQKESYTGDRPPYAARSGRTWVRRRDGRWYEINSDSPEARRQR